MSQTPLLMTNQSFMVLQKATNSRKPKFVLNYNDFPYIPQTIVRSQLSIRKQ